MHFSASTLYDHYAVIVKKNSQLIYVCLHAVKNPDPFTRQSINQSIYITLFIIGQKHIHFLLVEKKTKTKTTPIPLQDLYNYLKLGAKKYSRSRASPTSKCVH